jgi:hypothetical protein
MLKKLTNSLTEKSCFVWAKIDVSFKSSFLLLSAHKLEYFLQLFDQSCCFVAARQIKFSINFFSSMGFEFGIPFGLGIRRGGIEGISHF